MSDYIKRESAIRALKKQRSDWNCDFNVPIDNCIEALKKVKSVELPTKCIAEVTIDKGDVIRYLKKNDYVQVVRCKDCDNADYAGCPRGTCYCMEHGTYFKSDDYCNYGKCEDGEEDD